MALGDRMRSAEQEVCAPHTAVSIATEALTAFRLALRPAHPVGLGPRGKNQSKYVVALERTAMQFSFRLPEILRDIFGMLAAGP